MGSIPNVRHGVRCELRAFLLLVFEGRVQGLECRLNFLEGVPLVPAEVMASPFQMDFGSMQFMDGPVQGAFLAAGGFGLGLGSFCRRT